MSIIANIQRMARGAICLLRNIRRALEFARHREPWAILAKMIFELKYDSFRALLYLEAGHAYFMSRNRNDVEAVAQLVPWTALRNPDYRAHLHPGTLWY